MSSFERDLNGEQRAVVLTGEGPCLVLAGAGSGKTRTITYRVAYLLEQGVKPEEILLVTFTNKAAAEMQRRVAVLTGRPAPLPWSGTFHHIGYRLLKQYAPLLGYQNNFTVLDSDDSQSLIKLCIKEVKSDEAGQMGKRFPSAAAIAAVISFSRNAELPLTRVIAERFERWQTWESEILSIARAYEERKKAAGAMDFDDLLVNFLKLLSETPPHPPLERGGGGASPPFKEGLGVVSPNLILAKLATQFRYILVDEYQDTNRIQASIIRELASVHRNVLVVGDDAQSIYSFRAADIENILNFTHEYPDAKTFKLETNYRSTAEILEVANAVVAHNVHQYEKRLHTRGEGPKPVLHAALDAEAEAKFVADKIEALLKAGASAQEIAVLFRAAFHSQPLEVELVSRGLPYDYRGGVKFFERAHVKDILSYLRIFYNLADTAAWLRVLTHEQGIGPAAAERVITAVRQTVILNPPRAGEESPGMQGDPSPPTESGVQNDNLKQVANVGRQVLSGRALVGWNNFVKIWGALDASASVSASITSLLKSPYRQYLEAEYIDSAERLQDLQQLARFAARCQDLAQFLAEATLQESYRAIEPDPHPASPLKGGGATPPFKEERGVVSHQPKIILSTIHQAKGLEWDAVFIINLASGAFPNERAVREGGLEEERRLFYVAVTRAKRQLYLTYPLAGGAQGDFLSGPSMFLDEITPGLLEDHSLLLKNSSVFNSGDLEYVAEDEPFPSKPQKLRPRSFLAEVEDL